MALRVGVFGGNGFVGSKVLEKCVASGLTCSSYSRSGKPPFLQTADWASKVNWKKADALDKSSFEADMKNLDAIVVSIGAPPVPAFSDEAYEAQIRLGGDTCANVLEACGELGIPRVVLVSAAMPAWVPKGYREGKEKAFKAAEAFVEKNPDNSAVVLQPGGIYGVRHTPGGQAIPLQYAMAPLAAIFSGLTQIGLFPALVKMAPGAFHNVLDAPLVSVDKVAQVCLDGVQDVSKYDKGLHVIDPKEVGSR